MMFSTVDRRRRHRASRSLMRRTLEPLVSASARIFGHRVGNRAHLRSGAKEIDRRLIGDSLVAYHVRDVDEERFYGVGRVTARTFARDIRSRTRKRVQLK